MASRKREDSENEDEGSEDSPLNETGTRTVEQKYKYTRNLVGFWILGLCNNFSYVVMLSAAHDILHPKNTTANHNSNSSSLLFHSNGSANGSSPAAVDGLECNPLSTGTVLLADILPAVLLKATAPFYMKRISYNIRVIACILFAFASFFLIAYSTVLWLSLFGVVCASISSGLGEITLLSFSAHFDRNVVSTWSSGTGAAGLFGALSYAGLISAGLSPRTTVLVMNIIPLLFGVSFWFILEHPDYMRKSSDYLYSPIDTGADKIGKDEDATEKMTLLEKLTITKVTNAAFSRFHDCTKLKCCTDTVMTRSRNGKTCQNFRKHHSHGKSHLQHRPMPDGCQGACNLHEEEMPFYHLLN